MSEEFDAVVVGAGAGGGFAAMALAEGGLRVLLLDRGRRFDPGRDYPMNHPDWEIRPRAFEETPLNTGQADPSIFLEDGAPLDPRYRDLCSRQSDDAAAECPDRRRPFHYSRAFGVGGSTLHYQGEAHRFAPAAFRPASLYGFGDDWPISYEDLAPYYKRAERILGVAGAPGNPFKPAREPFPTAAHPLSKLSRRIAAGAAGLDWSLQPNALALPTRSVDGRPPCQRSGGCTLGCIFGAKSSVDMTAIPRGERTGRLAVRPRARALELEADASGKVSGLIYRTEQGRARVRARAYILALGAVETPRLLLSSRPPGHPDGVANGSGLVGRYFMEMMYTTLEVRFGERLDPYVGAPIDSRIWDFAPPGVDRGCQSGFVLGVNGTASGYHGPVSYALRLPSLGFRHKRAMREQFGTVAVLFGVADHEPRFENRVLLHPDRRDDDGVPLAQVRTDLSETDLAALEAMLARCRELAEASGAAALQGVMSAYDRPAASHVGGGCRMGRTPATSVVDPHGRAHEVPNLFIADASVLVGQGAGDSPSLTIQALALRTAARIRQKMSRKEL